MGVGIGQAKVAHDLELHYREKDMTPLTIGSFLTLFTRSFLGLTYNQLSWVTCISLLANARLIWMNAKHRELALIDRLTGAESRLSGDIHFQKLERRRLRRQRWPWLSWLWCATVTVAELDVDLFRAINSKFGHDGGDFALQEVVRIIKEQLRQGARLIRVGGEELRILLPGVGLEEGMVIVERLRQALETTLHYQPPAGGPAVEIPITVSMGVAVYESTPFTHVVKKADRALYRAKQGGRNKVMEQSAEAPPRTNDPAK